jgi:hypothetical protein
MQKKAPDKFLGRYRNFLDFVIIFAVFAGESDLSVVNGFDSVVGDGDAMCITAKIFKHLFGPGKGPFRIYDPLWIAKFGSRRKTTCRERLFYCSR